MRNPRLRARFERQTEEARRMTREQKESLAALLPPGRVRFDEPMASHSAIGVGGPAEAFVVAEEAAELKAAIAWAMERAVDYRFWGGGSRTLVRDGGVRGVVIALGRSFGDIAIDRASGEEAFVRAGAAARVGPFAEWCAEEALSGAASAAGRQGTIGGGLLANAGAQESLGDLVEEITVVDREGRELTMRRAALRFEGGQLKLPRTMAITRVLFKLTRAAVGEVRSKTAEEALRWEGGLPAETKRLDAIFKSAGRTPAEVLIEEAGFAGVRVGGARVAQPAANRIVNEGRATARDVIVLMNLIRERVKEKTDVVLESAITVVGEGT